MPTPLHILVVDDHPHIADYLKQSMESMGHRVDTAGNGIEAMNAIESRRRSQDPHQLVIADITMPLLDGLSLIKELRRAKDHVDVALMTGNVDMIARVSDDVQRLGCIAVLTKPINPVHLGQVLDFVTTRQARATAFRTAAHARPAVPPTPSSATAQQRRPSGAPPDTGEYQPHATGRVTNMGTPPPAAPPPARRQGDPRFVSGFQTPPPQVPLPAPPQRPPVDPRYTSRVAPPPVGWPQPTNQLPPPAAPGYPPQVPYHPPQRGVPPPVAQPLPDPRYAPPGQGYDPRRPAAPPAAQIPYDPRRSPPAAPPPAYDPRLAPPAIVPQDPRRASRLTQLPPAALPSLPAVPDGRTGYGAPPPALEPRRAVPPPGPSLRTPLPQDGSLEHGGSPFTRSLNAPGQPADPGADPFAQSTRVRRTVVGTVTTPLPAAPDQRTDGVRMVACAYCRGSFRAAIKPLSYNLVCVHCGQLNRIDP